MNEYVIDAAYVITGIWLVSFVAYAAKHIFDYFQNEEKK
jgi:hypothetical protein